VSPHHTDFDRRVNRIRDAMRSNPRWGKPCSECGGKWLSRQNRPYHEPSCSQFQNLHRKASPDMPRGNAGGSSGEGSTAHSWPAETSEPPATVGAPLAGTEGEQRRPERWSAQESAPSRPDSPAPALPPLTADEIAEQDRERAALADIRSPVFASREIGEEWRFDLHREVDP
jgi:hypothetical protein